MLRILYTCLDATVAAVFLIPLFLYLDRRYIRDRKQTMGYILFAVYLSGMFAVVGLPDIRYVRFDPRYNIIPFAYMFSDLDSTLLNVLLFLPLGFFLPVLWKDFHSVLRTVLFGFFCSLFIESLQIFTRRATDINDLMTNTVGAFLGWILGRVFLRLIPSREPGNRTEEVYWVCGASFGVMFFLQPFLADLLFRLFGL